MSAGEEPEELTPAERGLARRLALLQGGPEPPASLATHVIRTARWQQTVRSPLLAVAHLAAAAADAVRLLLGGARP